MQNSDQRWALAAAESCENLSFLATKTCFRPILGTGLALVLGHGMRRDLLPDGPNGMKNKILIVDDNQVILKTLSMKLTAVGYEVITAEDGGSAVGLVRSKRPDLVILDISFPPDVGHGGGIPWDGFLILDWLRRLEEAKNIPFIIITGGDPARYESRALAAGASKFFHKPVNNDDLLAAIKQVLEPQPQAAA